MYAVIVTGGKQYKVAPGEYLKIEKLEIATGESVTFDRVLLVGNGDDVNIGAPLLLALPLWLKWFRKVVTIRFVSSSSVVVSTT